MGSLINVVAFHSKPEKEGTPFPAGPVQGVPNDEVLTQFIGWEDEVQDLLGVCFIAHDWWEDRDIDLW